MLGVVQFWPGILHIQRERIGYNDKKFCLFSKNFCALGAIRATESALNTRFSPVHRDVLTPTGLSRIIQLAKVFLRDLLRSVLRAGFFVSGVAFAP
jgi:hypothetical protein